MTLAPEALKLARRCSDQPLLLIGMVHLEPLPGSARWGASITRVLERAIADARMLAEAGFDGVMVENFGDKPFSKADLEAATIAGLAVAARAVRDVIGPDLLLGVNALRNDAEGALAAAIAAGADLIRINVHCGAMLTDQGMIEGRADATLRLRSRLRMPIAIFADILVKHAWPLVDAPVAELVGDTVERGLADALVVSGRATGSPVDLDRLRAVREAASETPLFTGSGTTRENLESLLGIASGAIVGSSLKQWNDPAAPVDPEKARALVAQRDRLVGAV